MDLGPSDPGPSDLGSADPGPAPPFLPTEATFECITRWTPVRRFYLANVLGHEAEALKAAEAEGTIPFPEGTIIQLIPTEAMVKRAPGFAAVSNDWEFFSLGVSADGTKILDRGSSEVVNQFGGDCLSCHAPAKDHDLLCETGHGCDPLPFTEAVIRAVQDADPRCP